MRPVSLVVVLSILACAAVGAWAQQADQPPQNPNQGNPFAMWDVQKMIERATSQVVKRYNLTPEQEEFTRNLMATRVNAFLDGHETEIREIFKQAVTYQISGNPPPPEKIKEWTAQITPMFEEAKGLIVQGNHDFREILSDDQKKIHDVDLKIMEKNFADAEQRIGRWREGDFNPDRDFRPPERNRVKVPRRSAQTAPAAPVSPEAAPAAELQASAPEPATQTPAAPAPQPQPAPAGRFVSPGYTSTDRTTDLWEMYVRRFIQNYELDQVQANLAMQILDETKKRASEYLASRKDEYQRLQTQLADVSGNQEASAQIQKQIAELNKPVQEDLFNEMKDRLDRIPTAEQRKAYEAAHPKKPTASAPASRATATQPTSTRPGTLRPSANRSAASRSALRRMAPATRPARIGQPAAVAPAPAAVRPAASN